MSTTLPFLRGAELIHSAPADATFLVDRGGPVKISFFGALVLGRVGELSACDDTGVRVASLLDLAAQKVRVVQDGDLGELPDHVKRGLAEATGAVREVDSVALVAPQINRQE